MTLQVLGQAEVRRPQRIMKLVEAGAIVLTRQITLDILEQLLDALEAGIKGGDLVL